MEQRAASPRFVLCLAALAASVVARSGVESHDPDDWLLENVMSSRASRGRTVRRSVVLRARRVGRGVGVRRRARVAYLDTQGDVWDSHKDTALAIGGSFATLVALAAVRRWRRSRSAR